MTSDTQYNSSFSFPSYSQISFSKGDTEEVRFKANLILDEFGTPFGNFINRVFRAEELFYSLCGESPATFRSGMLVDGTVVKILSSDMIIRLNCGLEIDINLMSVLEREQTRNCKLTDFFFIGKPVKARILNVSFPPRDSLFDEVPDVQKLIKVELSMKETDLNNHDHYCSLLYHSIHYLQVNNADDFPKPIKHTRTPFTTTTTKQINSPYFKSLTEEEAAIWLDSLPDGSVSFLLLLFIV